MFALVLLRCLGGTRRMLGHPRGSQQEAILRRVFVSVEARCGRFWLYRNPVVGVLYYESSFSAFHFASGEREGE